MSSIYTRPVRLLLREMIDVLAPDTSVVFSNENAIDWFAEHYPKIKEGTITAHLNRFSTNAPSRIHTNFQPDEDILFKLGNGQYRRYDPQKDPAPIHDPTDIQQLRPDREPSDNGGEFAYESDLRDFLARNLSILEPGLKLYEEEGIKGIEFPAGGRYIDILAQDTLGDLVVIELKVSKG